ncbi:MAG: SurA N-terminal domain-containing protein [Bdellovibrionales bacterium]
MLEVTKASRRQTWTAYILFGAIILVFVFFGFKTVDSGSAGYAAQVNHEIISVADFKRQFDQRLQFYSMMFGGNYNPTGPQLARLKNDVLEQLIGEKLVAQAAEQAGFRASDAQIRDQILSIPAFQKDGRFQRDRYEGYLQQIQISAGQFEKDLKDSARVSSVRSVMSDVLKPTELELQKNKELANLRADADYVEVDTNEVQKLPVSESEVQAFLAQPDAETKLKSLFEQNKQRYETTEQVRASHILFRFDNTPASEQAALKKAQDFARRAKTEDFGNLAARASEDPGSKAKKGDLGFFTRGKMDETFEKAAFELKPGIVSEPVKSQFGYHLIKVMEKKPAQSIPFEKAKMELAKEAAAAQKAEKIVTQLDEALKAQDNTRLNKVVAENNLKWQSTGPFDLTTQTIPKVGPVEDFTQTVFELTPQKPLANRVVRFASKAYAIRYKAASDVALAKKDTKNPQEPAVSEQLARGRLSEVLMSWEKTLLSSSKVSRNSMILE